MERQTIVINLFGGPGAGKSRNRAKIFGYFKDDGANVEEIIEWVKYKVYEKSTYVFTDQIYIFAKQLKWIKQTLGQVDIIVTDSPILLSAIYDSEQDPVFRQLVLQEFNKLTNVNFYIERFNPYNPIGRHQTEEEAKEVDVRVREFLVENNIPFTTVIGNDYAGKSIFDHVKRGMLFPQ